MTPILTTKLYLPRLRPDMVSRPRLLERLNQGLHCKLTLISAPAGFGKTTLVSAWLAGLERPSAWLSLDAGENDLTRFLVYLVAALQTIAPTQGEGVLQALQANQPEVSEAVLTALLNELAGWRDPFVLVLDDYHLIDAQPVDQVLTYLVEHLPPQMHLVIATREDPHLPLARLRARGELTELRAADLRFTLSEATAFLKQVASLSLSPEDIARLSERTEGWIAGLQLAALSMQNQQDIPRFIQTFAGDHLYIVDYLVGEVLGRQPEAVRNFLLQTSILDQLHGSLCSAVTGQEGGKERLEALERGNFFVVPLDNTRQWYRYHHLFAQVLSAHLLTEQADQVTMLHQRASKWYEEHGLVSHAIRHALSARDFTRAADLIELAIPAMRRSREDALLLDWFKALPEEVVQFRPVLSVGYAYALLSCGDLEAAQARLRDAEQWLDMATNLNKSVQVSAAPLIVVDQEEFHRLPAFIAIYRTACSQALGDVPGTVKYAREALAILPEGEKLGRGAAAALLGLASWTEGDLETAYSAFADGITNVRMAGNLSDAISGAGALADIRMAQGRLREAMRIYERTLQGTLQAGEPVLRGTADLYTGISELYREQNDLHAAMQALLKSKDLSERTGLPYNRSRWCVVLARIREAEGDLDGALDLLDEAEGLYMHNLFPDIRPVTALKARLWIAQGSPGKALAWVREQGLSVSEDLSYLREFKHITLARVLLANAQSDHTGRSILEARGLLKRLLKAAEDGKRMGSVLDILVQQTFAYQMQGDISNALRSLQQALDLAEPEGYVRLFVDEGPYMARLLQEAAQQGISPSYAHHLLTILDPFAQSTPASQHLLEPLSKRELAVLRLLRTELDGPEIASQLTVSLNTVRTHTKNIYSKLGVNNRRAAVRRAEELKLF